MSEGCPNLLQQCAPPPGNLQQWLASAEHVDVVIVGGGVAGLAAARKLLLLGMTSLMVLEAQDRLGGRISTYREGDITVEDGAQWIHGGTENQVYRIADKLGVVVPEPPDHKWADTAVVDVTTETFVRNYKYLLGILKIIEDADNNGILEPYYDTGYGQYYIDRLKVLFGSSWGDKTSKAYLHFLEQLVSSEEGTADWMSMSARDADQYIDFGDDYEWKGGYDNFIKYLTKDIPKEKIGTSSPVSTIMWDLSKCDSLINNNNIKDGSVLVVTSQGSSYITKHVIVTSSIEYLKRHHTCMFSPNLPSNFTESFQSIELGHPNKIFIGWHEQFWGNELLEIYVVWTDHNLPEEMSWLYGVSTVFSTINNPAVLQTFVTGPYSKQMEDLDEETVKAHMIHLISKLILYPIPEPTFFRRTTWSKKPYIYGSYSSYITTEGAKKGLHSRAAFRTPITNHLDQQVIFWAGEHTSDKRYGTVDGAFGTGEREASRIVNKSNCCRNTSNSLKHISNFTWSLIIMASSVFLYVYSN